MKRKRERWDEEKRAENKDKDRNRWWPPMYGMVRYGALYSRSTTCESDVDLEKLANADEPIQTIEVKLKRRP